MWDVALVGAYDLIGNYPTIVTQSGDSLDHLFSSHFSEEHEENVEKVLNYCLDKHSQVLIALQMVIEKETTSQGVTIKEDDIVLDEESILELKSEPLEHKREYLKAIMKEFADLCRNECFSLEVIPEERSPSVTATCQVAPGSARLHSRRTVHLLDSSLTDVTATLGS